MATKTKFNRNYKLVIQSNDGGEVVIEPPFTIQFDIQRNVLSSASAASVRIYNLSETTRSLIRKNRTDWGLQKTILLLAGYGEDLSIALSADVSQCWSVREGVNFISQIECFDGGFAFSNGQISKSYPAGTTQKAVIEDMVDNLRQYGISKGSVGEVDGTLKRGNSYSGPACTVLREITNGAFFIDNGKAHVLNENEAIGEDTYIINADTGLLGTPIREDQLVTLNMLFEPKITVGQKVELESNSGENFNGEYKVVGVKHRGIISPSQGGEAMTTLQLAYGDGVLTTVGGFGL